MSLQATVTDKQLKMTKWTGAAAIAGCCLALRLGSAAAHEGHEQDAPAFEMHMLQQPTPAPDRVVLTWSGDPATSIDVTWRTDDTVEKSTVEFVPAADIVGNLEHGNVPICCTVEGTSADFASDRGPSRMHTAHLEGLRPDTMYAYRVGNGQFWSEWLQFRTAAAEAKPFTFIYFGDAQNAIRSLWSRVIREANLRAPRAAFMLHAGDLINSRNSDAEWGEWFGAGGWINGTIPSVATPGNHEYGGGAHVDDHWRPQFAFPLNGPPGLEETAYWFDYQGTRIISLNSNERLQQQRHWLKSLLDDPERPKWTIVTFHHPIYSAAKERDNAELREQWQAVLEEGGVDLVLQGHDHAYARSALGGPKNVAEGVRRQESNTVYVVSVSGPKQYPLAEAWDVSRNASGVQLFQIIHVSSERISYEARLATGELYDGFTLLKSADGQSELIEQIPPTPEIREQP
ncbi:MAG: metallophosphoesterase [Planctomycetaceae bacterium]|nr:metallophosphoesterase [Planctomycetaceae bacterium]